MVSSSLILSGTPLSLTTFPLFSVSSLSSLFQVGLVRVVVSLESPGPAEMPRAPVLHVPPAPAALPAAPVLRARAGGPEQSAAVHPSGGTVSATSASPMHPRTAVQQYRGTVGNVAGLPLEPPTTVPPAAAVASAPPPEYQVAWELEVWKRGGYGRGRVWVDASIHVNTLYSSMQPLCPVGPHAVPPPPLSPPP